MDAKKETWFYKDLMKHHQSVQKEISRACEILVERAQDHDMDKIHDEMIFSLYNEHRQKQKSMEFGSPERRAHSKLMAPAADKHSENSRHHYYNDINSLDFDALDIIESVVDIIATVEERKEKCELADYDKFLEISAPNVSAELKKIMRNTAKSLLKEKNE